MSDDRLLLYIEFGMGWAGVDGLLYVLTGLIGLAVNRAGLSSMQALSISVANAGASTVRRTLWRAEQHRVLVWRTNLQTRAAGRNISEINVGLKVIIIL